MDSLTAQINAVLAQYTKNVNETVDSILNSTSKEAVIKLKETSPQAEGGGKYAKSWAVKKKKGTYTIYNKQPGLTHLLENGHDVVVNGRKVGRAPAQPHIKEVDDWLSEEIVQRMESSL